MPGIRDFFTLVEVRNSSHFITLRTPLTADANRSRVGWVTRVTLLADLHDGGEIHTATAERVTTFVSHVPCSLRRRLQDRPQTTDKIAITHSGVRYTTVTRWCGRQTSSSSTIPELSFDLGDLIPLLRGVVETREGRPLLDWLAENTSEFAPYLSQAGRLPETLREFHAMNRERYVGDDAPFFDEAEGDDPDLDRWR